MTLPSDIFMMGLFTGVGLMFLIRLAYDMGFDEGRKKKE